VSGPAAEREPPLAMNSLIILVNGLPGAGKTTLARTLSRALRLPMFSKDTIKETHADVLGSAPPGWTQRRWNAALGAAASETMWALLAAAPTGAILESCWPVESRHFAVRGLRHAGDRTPLEVWCDVPIDVARRRFEQRHPRHPIHGEPPTDAEWAHWRVAAQPLHLGPLIQVDTTHAVDADALIAWIHQQPRASGYCGRS
jgi:predicted kinase